MPQALDTVGIEIYLSGCARGGSFASPQECCCGVPSFQLGRLPTLGSQPEKLSTGHPMLDALLLKLDDSQGRSYGRCNLEHEAFIEGERGRERDSLRPGSQPGL